MTIQIVPLIFLLVTFTASAGCELVEVLPLTDRILMLHFDEGEVLHHSRGQSRSDEQVRVDALDVSQAGLPSAYRLSSTDDSSYATQRKPLDVGRKSKGTDFAWFADRWENGRAVNTRPDHTKEHWLYLHLPEPLRRGHTYILDTGSLAKNGKTWRFLFDETKLRSEAVHVNLLGYVPSAPRKYGYVYHWMGDRGALDLKAYAGRAFQLINRETLKPAFSGKLVFRAAANQQETFHKSDSPPDGNFLKSDVYECDFSDFNTPGNYILSCEGIGCSFPFEIRPDIYRTAFKTVARGLYHNRSGLALERPFTDFTRPAPHNPKLTPGFDGKLIYTTVRWPYWGSEGGDPKVLMQNSKGPLKSAGWYQDAGDWDSYYTHLRVAQELLLAFELMPANFTDGELNIPESSNGVPDIIDEAAWLPRFCHRLRHELLKTGYGTGGVGLRVAGDAFGGDEKTVAGSKKVGQGSWEDVDRTWVVSGEDPWSTYRYAGAAAQLAYCLGIAGHKDPEGVDWAREATESYAWARNNTRPKDEEMRPELREPRAYAAAALFRLTGDRVFEEQFARDTVAVGASTQLWDDRQYGPAICALGGGEATWESALQQRMRRAVCATADALADASEKRALRWGGNWYMPMLVGQQTTPWVLQAAVARAIVKNSDPARAERYGALLYTTCDYFLGCNALNMTWVTGLGPRHPSHVFHMDAWYNGKGEFHPGIIPYGPWRKEKNEGQGPWDAAWPHKTVYPSIDAWPGNEMWFDNRCSPLSGEFTIHQNTAPAAALFGVLCEAAR